ncbi:MAG TPA: non-canonical purine NTP pyrophosphatase [Eubacteriaceae bacterium]|nr:non-canonical purine NTP pyrophosphatase [Eubacteriaceae bacterium]
MKIVVATQNQHKKDEILAIMGPQYPITTMKEEGFDLQIEETGTTFEENAMIKARALKEHTHACVLADDSGLEVDHLDGAPGVYSARFAGEDATDSENNKKLLNLMDGVEEEKRSARFVCVIAFIDEENRQYLFRGECEGKIAKELSGENGFGYDPLFVESSLQKTYAELKEKQKNQLSHRANALRQIKDFLDGQNR